MEKDIKQQNKTSQTPKEKTDGKWKSNGTNASKKQCVVNNLQERNSKEIVVQLFKCFWVK